MKILVVPSWYPPNGGRFFKLQAEALAKLGHKVDVLILEEKGITQKVNPKIDVSKSEFVNELRNDFLRIPKLNNFNIKRFINKYRKFLMDYLEENMPDVIHVHSAIWAGVVVAKIAQEKNIPFVITEHRSLFFDKDLAFTKNQITDIKYAFNSSANIISVSEAMKSILKKYTSTKNSVIPNMVNTSYFKLRKNKIKTEAFIFLAIGNLIPIKGFDILLNAFAEIKKNKQNVLLKIVGVGKDLEKLKEQSKELKIEKRVEFCAYKTREELREMFHEATAFVSSSRKEPFGVVITEALCCGLPIVVTKSGGPEDIVNETNGYLAENKNASSLHAKMQLMIDNINNFDSKLISKVALNTYSEKVISESLEKQLKNATKSN